MCEELELEGVRRWFYGGTPPPDEGERLAAGEATSAKAFATVVLAAAGAAGARTRAAPRPDRQLPAPVRMT